MNRHRLTALATVVALAGCDTATGPTGTGQAAAPDTAGSPDALAQDATVDDADAGPTWTPPTPALWPPGPSFDPSGVPFVAAHPAAFARVSAWATEVSGPVDDRPGVSHRGGYGTGNGWTFALLGLADPLNTLHGLTTPTYERGVRFFGDYALVLRPEGADHPPDFDAEQAAWSLSAPVVMTRATLGDLRLDTVDFAPTTDDEVLRACFVRVLTVTNDGAAASSPVTLQVVPANIVSSPAEGQLVEDNKERVLLTAFADGGGAVEGQRLTRALPALEAGAGSELVLVHCGADGDVPVALPGVDAGALIDATAAAYQAWAGELVQLDVPDPRVADFVDGLKMSLRVQTAAGGASCPMSQYTRTWARDNIGPALALLTLGAHDDVAAMMDYIYGATLLAGDFKNSYDADLDLSDLPPAPDWAAKGPLPESVAAETPSYMVWIYGAWEQHTGLTARASERWSWLRRAMMAQGFGPEGHLPFTGDETFRAAMNAAFGLALEYPHHLESWSANSTLLWLGAERHYARLAGLLGQSADATEAAGQRALVDATLTDTFLLADGCISALQWRADGVVWPAPFEDVATKILWARARDDDDALAASTLACLISRLGVEPGRLQSPLHPDYTHNIALPVDGPVYTGMLPGYTLMALTRAGHPEAEDAFDVLGQALGTSGQLQEYQVGSDHSGLTILYDPSGQLTDYTAKFRPWEGGIVVHAALEYLLGWAPDATSNRFALRPHLPNDWPSVTATGLRIGADRVDVSVSRVEQGLRVSVTSHADGDLTFSLRCDGTDAAEGSMSVDGESPPEAALTQRAHFGQVSMEASGLSVAAGATVVVRCLGSHAP